MKKLNALVKEALSAKFLTHAGDVAVKKWRKHSDIAGATYPLADSTNGYYLNERKPGGDYKYTGDKDKNGWPNKKRRYLTHDQVDISEAVSKKNRSIADKKGEQALKFFDAAKKQRLENIGK